MGRVCGLVLTWFLALAFCGQSFAQVSVNVETGQISGLDFKPAGGGGDGGGGGSPKGKEPVSKPEPGQGFEKWKITKCGENACVRERSPKASPVSPPAPIQTPAQISQAKRDQEAAKLEEAGRQYRIEQKLKDLDKPIETSNGIIKWFIGELIGRFSESAKDVWDAMSADDPEMSVFDEKNIHKDGQLLVLREALDQEKKEMLAAIKAKQDALDKEKDANQKAYEENSKKLLLDGKTPEPMPAEDPVIRGPASVTLSPAMQSAVASIKALAAIKGDNFSAIADHVFTRGIKDSDMPISPKLAKEINKALAPFTPANACAIGNGACVLHEGAKGDSCYCPKMVSATMFVRVNGMAVKRSFGEFCRRGDASIKMPMEFPIGVSCTIPVDVTMNPAYPQYENILGRVSAYECKSWADKFSGHCD
jgi:hypothetical protein